MNPLRPDILNVMTLFTYILSFLGNTVGLDVGLQYRDSFGFYRALSHIHVCICSFIHLFISSQRVDHIIFDRWGGLSSCTAIKEGDRSQELGA